jgi:hypothetical protein
MRPTLRSLVLAIVPVVTTLAIIVISPHGSAQFKLEVVAGVLAAIGAGLFGGWALTVAVKRLADREAQKIARLGS